MPIGAARPRPRRDDAGAQGAGAGRFTSFDAMKAKSPRMQPEITPMTGPVRSIIALGGSGMPPAIAASAG